MNPGGLLPVHAGLFSAAMMRWLNEHSSDGVVTTDTHLIVQSWNTWMATATGVPAAEIIGRSLLEAFPSLKDRGLDDRYADALGGRVQVLSQRLHRFIFPAIRAGRGSEQMLQGGRIAPLYDDDVIVGTITVIEDCSERASTERALRAQIERAEAARETAETASRVKDEFLATLSHEIRTPLNAVLGWARILLERDPLDAALVRRAMEVIDRNAKAQLTLIGDLLDMARISAGKVRLDVAAVDLAAVVLAAIDVVRPAADSKGVRLIADLAPQLPPLAGDADRLQQVVWNLLSNAVKFTDAGGKVMVGLSTVDGATRLTVSDTGQGITPAFLPAVFERFKQADPSSSRRSGGLGIGLALVKDLVELHGGVVTLDSAGVGAGTTATVTLPSRTPFDVASLPESLVAPQPEPHRNLAGVRVLLVDDDPDAVEIVTRTLVDAGAIVAAATSAEEAIAALSAGADEERPHVVVADIGPPAESGYTLLSGLRALPAGLGGRLPVVSVSAFATTSDRRRAIKAGFESHVAKPFVPRLLLMAVAGALTGSAPERRGTVRQHPSSRRRSDL
jgi:PAS domain S-box-containing protein